MTTTTNEDFAITINTNNEPLLIVIIVILALWFLVSVFKGVLKTYLLKKRNDELVEANAV